jgi:hypothetical protein
VRAGAALCGSIATIGVAGVAHCDVWGSTHDASIASRALQSDPFLSGRQPLLMTIDMPYVACWALASWGGGA